MYSRFRWLVAAIVSGGCLAAISMETLAQAYPARASPTGHSVRARRPDRYSGTRHGAKAERNTPRTDRRREPGRARGGMIAHAYRLQRRRRTATRCCSATSSPATPSTRSCFPRRFSTTRARISRQSATWRQGAIFLYVSASLPVHNVKELIDLAKSKPGQLSFGSAGAGHFPTHIGSELFKTKNGLDVLHVPYKGAGPALVDVSAGRVSFRHDDRRGRGQAVPRFGQGPGARPDGRQDARLRCPTFRRSRRPGPRCRKWPPVRSGAWWGRRGCRATSW